MVMATGQDRSRPGGPYVTAGLKKISGPSSDTVLHTQRYSKVTYQHNKSHDIANIYDKIKSIYEFQYENEDMNICTNESQLKRAFR